MTEKQDGVESVEENELKSETARERERERESMSEGDGERRDQG